MTDIKSKVFNHAFTSANFPTDEEGRTYHVSTKPGEVANRIVTVGDHYRAFQIAEFFDNVTKDDLYIKDPGPYKISKPNIFIYMSKRKYLTITGTYKGVPVSVVAICMGFPMVDFFIRETRAVVKGPIALIRFGSCGCIKDVKTGSVAVATNAFGITRNYDYFNPGSKETSPYIITDACEGDPELQKILLKNMKKECESSGITVIEGANGSADSFYSSQGRTDENFVDCNEKLFDDIKKKHPDCATLEMETYLIFHLAKSITATYYKEHDPSNEKAKSKNLEIRPAATTMIFANRVDNSFIDYSEVPALQQKMIKGILDSLIELNLGTADELQPDEGSIWEAMVKNYKN